MAHVEMHRWELCRSCTEAGRTKPDRNPDGSGKAEACRCKITAWRTRWRNPAGAPRSEVFARKLDANQKSIKVENDKLTGAYIDPRDGKQTFKSYAEDWRQIQVHADGTEQLVEQHLRLHVYPRIGDRPIGAVRTSEVQALVKAASQTLAASTVEVVYSRVKAVFKAAVRDRLRFETPCVDIKLPKPKGKVDNVMTVDQVLAIAGQVPERYRALVLVGAGTGLRPGELFGLTVPAIDFLRRTLDVERQMVRVRGQGVELRDILKTEASRRRVPLAKVVVDILADHLRQWPAHPELGLIFTNQRGGPIQQYPLGEVWKTARGKAGVPEWANGPHQLRHHFASLLIEDGASVKVVQKRLGHASAKTTLDTYGHMFPDNEDATRAAVEKRYGAQPEVDQAPAASES